MPDNRKITPKQKLTPQEDALNHEHERILQWLKKVRFRKSLFGGVNEQDLWKKLGELNDLYEAAISAERARYDALLEAQQKSANNTVARYKAALTENRNKYNALVRTAQKLQAQLKEQGQQTPGDDHAEKR